MHSCEKVTATVRNQNDSIWVASISSSSTSLRKFVYPEPLGKFGNSCTPAVFNNSCSEGSQFHPRTQSRRCFRRFHSQYQTSMCPSLTNSAICPSITIALPKSAEILTGLPRASSTISMRWKGTLYSHAETFWPWHYGTLEKKMVEVVALPHSAAFAHCRTVWAHPLKMQAQLFQIFGQKWNYKEMNPSPWRTQLYAQIETRLDFKIELKLWLLIPILISTWTSTSK